MILSLTRTTASGKETLTIKEATDGIAYAVLRRFLPDIKDGWTPDPATEKAGKETNEVEPFRVPLDTAVDLPEKPDKLPNFLTSDTTGAIKLPDDEPTEREFAGSTIKSTLEEARKQFQEVSNDLKDKLVAPSRYTVHEKGKESKHVVSV